MLTPPIAPPFPLRWGFSTRQDHPEDLPPIRLKQVHGCGLLEAPFAERLEGDGLWTTRPGIPIGVRVADCTPVLLAGQVRDGRPWIAALHAGWRGTLAGILREAIAVFKALGGDPRTLTWALGPSIQSCCFEVGPEVIETARQDPAWREGLATPKARGKFHLDLHGLLRAQALELDLDPARDGSIPRCTRCEPDTFFSYRRGDLDGRQWGWIELSESMDGY